MTSAAVDAGSTPPSGSVQRPRLLLAGILVLALALRLPGLGESLWNDELWSTHVKLGDFTKLLRTAARDIHPPLYLALMFVWIRVFGDSEISIRIPPLLFGLLSILLSYRIARRLLGEGAALLTAFLLATSPPHVWYSQEARHYTAALAFVLLATSAHFRLAGGEAGSGVRLAYLLPALAAVLTHYYALVFPLVSASFALRAGREARRRLLGLNAIVLLVFVAVFAVKVYVAGLRTSTAYLRDFDLFELWMVLFDWFVTGHAIWPVNMWSADFGTLAARPLMLLTHLFLFALTLHGLVRGTVKSFPLLCFFAALPAALLAAAALGLRNNYVERSLILVMPFFFMLLAEGVLGLGRSWMRRLALLSLCALCSVSLFHYYRRTGEWTVDKPHPDWRSAAARLRADMERDPRRAAVVCERETLELTYYDEAFRRWLPEATAPRPSLEEVRAWIVLPPGRDRDGRSEPLSRMLSREGVGSFYLLKDGPWLGPVASLEEELERVEGLRPLETWSFPGIQVRKFELVD